ncbi:unnamed protein product [Cyprideis torosa]|uniref:Triokinase/FMN cyclase n=1 Tax=Cyprideis torosa TaxID=163714 RepID=A0A7R8ZK35_9CRUS|nr:unnamed protein product [Cyprideis torosa]CAG0883596.1 unnamed protein product [Cyprideis torosa]
MAGSMLLLKIAGSMAEEGATLDDIKGKLEECAQQLGTIGVCLNPCTLPGQSDAMFPLSSAEIAFGLGVHGEAGIAMIPVASSSDLVEQMVDHMTDPANPSSVDLKEGSKVVVLINNLGSTSKTEELVFLRDVVKSLQSKGLDVIRTYSDRFMTSVDMAGVQMSVLVASDEILSHLDAPTSALAWPKDIWSSVTAPGFDLAKRTVVVEVSQEVEANEEGPKLSEAQSKLLKQILTSVVDDLIDSEDRINELDRGCGDGDCGTTLAIAAKAIKSSMDKYAFEYPLSLCLALARTIEQTAGGCGGGLYALFMMGAATAFEGVEAVTPEVWSTALEVGISRIKDYGGADVGDRTLLDALCPALSTWRSSDCGDIPALARGIREAATAGAASTKGAVAKVGRASYVSGPQLLVNPDPGATGAAVWIQTATREVEKSYFEDAAAVVL